MIIPRPVSTYLVALTATVRPWLTNLVLSYKTLQLDTVNGRSMALHSANLISKWPDGFNFELKKDPWKPMCTMEIICLC